MGIDYTRYYEKWHRDTPEHQAEMDAFYRRNLEAHLPADRAARVLDVGCGTGLALETLRRLGFERIQGIDCDAGQVKAARSRGLAVECVGDTTAYLAGGARAWDLILALDVLEHVPVSEQLGFVAGVAGALADAGRFLCTVPNANSAVAERWRYNDWTHHCSFTEHSLDLLLFSGGFAQILMAPVEFAARPARLWWPRGGVRHWWALRFFRLWRRLELMAELGPDQGRAVPLSLNLLAVARR